MSASNCVTRSSSVERAVDLRGGARARARRRRRTPAAESRVADAHRSVNDDEVRRQVGAGAQAVAAQDRRGHPRRRGLAVGADDVDRARSAPAASRARSAAGACGPGRSACRTARGQQVALGLLRASTAPSSSVLELRGAAARASRARPRRAARGALATKPSLASLPSARAISLAQPLALGVALARLLLGRVDERRQRGSRPRRRGPAPTRRSASPSPAEVQARQPRDERRRRRRGRPSARRRARSPGLTPASSRHERTALDRGDDRAPRAPRPRGRAATRRRRRPLRRRAGPPRRARAPTAPR